MSRFRIFSVWNIVFVMAIVVLFLLVVYPMGSIFQASLLSAETGEFTFASLGDVAWVAVIIVSIILIVAAVIMAIVARIRAKSQA